MGLSLELACPRAGGSLGVSTQQPKQKESGSVYLWSLSLTVAANM